MENIAIDKIQPNDYNPNEMTEAEFNECKAEVKHLGEIPKPIIVRSFDGVFIIVDGEQNWRAAKDLGFTELPCEVMSIDDLEAMRQTYKRNMHGTFNPLKLGKMFKSAIEKSGLSQRDLATQYEVSEGTVRNALMYCEAAEMRNGYAFEKLGVRQVRAYLRLPSVIRDKWLDAGADNNLLVSEKAITDWSKFTGKIKTDDVFDVMESDAEKHNGPGASYLNRFDDIHKWGLSEKIEGNKYQFKQSVERIHKFIHWAYIKLCGMGRVAWDDIKPYGLLMWDYFDAKDIGENLCKDFLKCMRLVKYQGEFRFTPDEFKKFIEDSRVFGCPEGTRYNYPQWKYVIDSLQAGLLMKGLISAPVDINKLADPAVVIMAAFIEKNAPDYLKSAKFPAEAKTVIFNFNLDPAIADVEVQEHAKQMTVEDLNKAYREAEIKASGYVYLTPESLFSYTPELIQDLLRGHIHALNQKVKDDSMTVPSLVDGIVKYSKLYQDAQSVKERQVFAEKLSKLTRDELKAIYIIMDYSYYLKRIRREVAALKR